MIEAILNKIGYNCDTSMRQHIDMWQEWYEGYIEKFHKYSTYNGRNKVGRQRASLKMAKRICEEWANLLLNEKVVINVGDEAINNRLKDVLTKNDFYVRSNMLLEKSFALGTGALVEYIGSDGEPVIDYITADKIFPISWEDTKITECAFVSSKTINGTEYYYFNIHTKNQYGGYAIQNRIFKKSDGTESELPKGVAKIYNTQKGICHFQIIRPNITNNIEESSPLGISIYANALDELKGVDLIYDSYVNEFRLGKKRILVPTTLAQIVQEEKGVSRPVFDDNDTEFYAIPGLDAETQKPIEINMDIRGNEHKEALQSSLNLLSHKCGLGYERYSFSGSGAKTATEIISENSELFRNLKKHEIILKSALISMVTALLALMKIKNSPKIVIEFDDSIIEDTNTEFLRRVQLVSSGAMHAWELRAWTLNETDEEAQRALSTLEDDIPEV